MKSGDSELLDKIHEQKLKLAKLYKENERLKEDREKEKGMVHVSMLPKDWEYFKKTGMPRNAKVEYEGKEPITVFSMDVDGIKQVDDSELLDLLDELLKKGYQLESDKDGLFIHSNKIESDSDNIRDLLRKVRENE